MVRVCKFAVFKVLILIIVILKYELLWLECVFTVFKMLNLILLILLMCDLFWLEFVFKVFKMFNFYLITT